MHEIRFRTICDADEPFLRHLYATTRADEMSLTPWSDEQKQAFLNQQFDAQHRHYRQHFAAARFELMLLGESPIGRLYLDQGGDEICIIDIALLPEYRGRGIGGQVMRNILSDAQQAGKPVRIHVEMNNPALRLYQRLGFERIGDTGVYWHLQWTPSSA